MADRQSLMSPSRAMSFPTDFEQIFDRMMRTWPFDWPARSTEPRALRAFEHMPKVEVKENDKAYTVTVELPVFRGEGCQGAGRKRRGEHLGREEGRADG